MRTDFFKISHYFGLARRSMKARRIASLIPLFRAKWYVFSHSILKEWLIFLRMLPDTGDDGHQLACAVSCSKCGSRATDMVVTGARRRPYS
jgi:hypothetical protein